MGQIKKFFTLFIVIGLVYLDMEIIFRSFRGDLIGFEGLTAKSMAAWSSIWMIGIGGLSGVVLGIFNEGNNKLPYIVRVLLGIVVVFLIEFVGGLIFNDLLNMSLWDYSDMPLNIMGHITLLYLPVWLAIIPFAFWLDDLLRSFFFEEYPPHKLIRYYGAIFNNKHGI